ncbi:hypothetical protein CFN78_07325 [Amycolatopsis antarctica]|uniref:Molecular chaperone DnaK n=1 Tax=Amycolatopsis antarctica TaxID=1854586 RepID=A0A263D6D6_9PSEU|nr:hypothetical protein [Amycolatopsis antarctica]OZM74074.1 hypothetical protein CFN78_07325 [Amycolatopsis antarctica]
MPYSIGIDVDPSRAVAAACRIGEDGHGPAETVRLGEVSASIPTALFLDEEGYLLVGDAALAAGVAEPERLITGFHERIGDDTPVTVAGEPFSAQSLSAAVIAWSVARAAEPMGEPPEQVTVTHPASWGRYRRELLRAALGAEGLGRVLLVPAPVAVLDEHTRAAGEPDTGAIAAVFDVGAAHLAPALLRRSAIGTWETLACADAVPFPGDAATARTVVEDAVEQTRSLARQASVDLRRLGCVALHGSKSAIPAVGDLLRGALACRPVALPDPDATAARGAAALAGAEMVRTMESAVAPVETTLLPKVADELITDSIRERPVRPPVRIAAPRISAPAVRNWRTYRPSPVAAGMVAAASLATVLTLGGDLSTVDTAQPAAPCAATASTGDGC